MGDQNSQIFELLKEIALQDGIMSPDETKIIAHVLKSSVTFENALKRAKQDGVIDAMERKELDELRVKIFEDAAQIAESDRKITGDESKLLNKLLEIIIQLKDTYDDYS